MTLLQQSMGQFQKKHALIKLLDTWREEGDEKEQKSTWEYLKQSLDEDRLSERKLFPYCNDECGAPVTTSNG
jgi:hypothetical protein